MTLRSALEELTHSARHMRLPDLRRLVESLRPETSEISPYIHFTDNKYSRNLISKTPDFEVLLLCWRPGQRSPIHDHANSICALTVIQGVLAADNYRKTAAGHVRVDYSEDFKPGAVLGIQTSEIHQVSNLQSSEDLVSLHFYLGPLEQNLVYSVLDAHSEVNRLAYNRLFTEAEGI